MKQFQRKKHKISQFQFSDQLAIRRTILIFGNSFEVKSERSRASFHSRNSRRDNALEKFNFRDQKTFRL